MKHPKPNDPEAAIIAAQSAIAHLLKTRPDPLTETFSRAVLAASLLFNYDLNELIEKHGGIEISDGEREEIIARIERAKETREAEYLV